MKKNFLKKLAFTMAFATVFTTLAPAAGVFAAKAPSLNVGKTLTLLLGTEREEFDINVNNKVSGSKYAWSTSNKAVATVNSKGVVEGQKVGSAKVTLKITLPSKKTANLSTTVDVKDNIKEVAIKNAPTEALEIGKPYNFDRTIVKTFGGNTKAHKGAVTRWFLNDTKTATIDDSGIFVATEAGEYEVTAKSFQSKAKYNQYLESGDEKLVTATSETVKVTVVNAVETVKQHDLASVDFVFGSELDIKEFDKANVHVNYLIGGVKIQEQKIKSVTLNADNKTVNVALYDAFIPEGTYAVSYPGMEDVTFKAAKIAAEEVVGIGFKTDEQVTVGESTDLQVNLFNKDGVIINQPSATATAGLNARVTYELVNNTNYLSNLTGSKLTIFNKNDIANVTATFHTYTYNGYVENVFTANRTFVGVDKTADLAKEILAWTISSGDADWTKTPQFIAVEDAGRRLFVNLLLKDGTTKYSNASDNYGSNKIKLTSSNSHILFVDELGYLNPITAGEVVITVEYNKEFVGSFKVVVSPKRVVTALTVDKTGATLSNAVNLGDSVTIEAKLVDQYGDAIENSTSLTVDTELLSGVNGIKPTISYNNNKVTFNAEGATKGNYSYKITHPGSATLNRVITIIVQEPDGPAVNWKLDMKSEYDMKVTKAANVDTDVHAIALYGYAKNGVKVTKESVSTGFSIKVVTSDNKEYDTTKIDNNFNVDLVSLSGTSVSGSPMIHKAKTGTYTVTAYKGTTPVASGAFKVVDTQKAPTFKINKFETNALNAAQAVEEAFVIDLNDTIKDVTPSYVNITGSQNNVGNRVRINYVHVDEAIGSYVLVHELTIGYYVTVAPEFVY